MTERKVASKQERLMFEQLIRQDMQNGIPREILSNSPNSNNYIDNNQNKIPTPNQKYNNLNNNNLQIPTPDK